MGDKSEQELGKLFEEGNDVLMMRQLLLAIVLDLCK